MTVISDTGYIVVATITVGGFPCGVAYDSGTHEVFVTNSGQGFGNTVSVISDFTNTVVANVTVGTGPCGVAYDSGKSWVFVSNGGGAPAGNTVSVISDGGTTVGGRVLAVDKLALVAPYVGLIAAMLAAVTAYVTLNRSNKKR